jgi:hypothetical protein
MSDPRQHWEGVYARRGPDQRSWSQPRATLSLELVAASKLALDAPIIDVGAGASTFVDGLLARGYVDITLLDASEAALAETCARIGSHAVHTVVEDIIRWSPPRRFSLWHDRAAFHFLTDKDDRASYRRVLLASLGERAHVVIATFAIDGPGHCSGLAVQRYGVEELAEEFAEGLRLVSARREKHITPSGVEQPFIFVHFVRR